MPLTSRWKSGTGIVAVALATLGCGGGETTVRPFIKRASEPEKTPDKTAEKTPADAGKTPEKTNGRTR